MYLERYLQQRTCISVEAGSLHFVGRRLLAHNDTGEQQTQAKLLPLRVHVPN